MKLDRNWITPLVAGAFLLSAITGLLMFFHLDTGANKFVHEWLSWVLVAFVVMHGATNFNSLKRHVSGRRAQLSIGFFVGILAISFAPIGEDASPPFVAPVRALAQAPLEKLAQIAKISPEQLIELLQEEGLSPQSDSQSLSDLIGSDARKQMEILSHILSKTGFR